MLHFEGDAMRREIQEAVKWREVAQQTKRSIRTSRE
jgi:hypothetical protein